MRAYKFALVLFVILAIFLVVPFGGTNVLNSLYRPHIILMYSFAATFPFVGLAMATRGQSLVEVLQKKQFKPWALLLFIYSAWIIFTSAQSPMPGFAFLGTSYLGFGSIAIISNILILLVFSKYAPVSRLIQVFIISTVIMLFISIIEAIGWRPLHFIMQGRNIAYPAATVGLRQHLAGWFTMMALAPIFFWRGKSLDRSFWIWMGSGLIGVAICKNSAASIATLLSLIIWSIYGQGTRRVPAIRTTIIFICLALALPPAIKSVNHALGFEDYEQKNYASGLTLSTRIILWKAAARATKERPILGWGDETFAWQVFQHLTPSESERLIRMEAGIPEDNLVIHSDGNYSYYSPNKPQDVKKGILLYIRPHNIIFDEAYSHGIIGLVLLSLSLFYILPP